ncbi:MAG: hypothetical protein GY822_04530 [Deltaproteobacteria bacterium]|nr:hypothetical protein [Deltaproteobacteria bacterium]
MRISAHLVSVVAAGFSVVLLSGCPVTPSAVIQPPPDVSSCEQNSECAEGEICSGGTCASAQCDPNLGIDCRDPDGSLSDEQRENYCCGIGKLCNELAACVPDPDAPILFQCEVSEDCAAVGDFCSGGTCYNPAGRRPCTASHQCPASERCDVTVFLCVPDNGGCNYCDQLPELCCDDSQDEVCDPESGFCVGPGIQECTPQTQDQDCRGNQTCNSLGQCVQCTEDADCGPGTLCNAATGSCYSNVNNCETDEDCDDDGKCNAINQCVQPQCEADRDCSGIEVCDVNTFTCYLPPAVCNETDAEPNGSLGEASPLTGGAFAGTVCRGDSDYISFPIQPSKRYRVSFNFTGFVSDILLDLLDTNGAVLDTENLSFDDSAILEGFTAADATGNFFIKVNGLSITDDVEAYSITVEETDAPDVVTCDQEIPSGVEPNDSVSEAHTIGTGNYTFFRCGFEDDYYRVEVPPLHGISVRLEYQYDDGDLNANLLGGEAPFALLDSADSGFDDDIERVEYGEVALAPHEECETLADCSVFYLHVEYDDGWSVDPLQQVYTLIITEEARSEECSTDPHEFDGSQDFAHPLATPTENHDALLCSSADADFYTFNLAAGLGGNLVLEGFEEHNLKLEVDTAEGAFIGSSDTSTTSVATESVPLPFSSAEQSFMARVLYSNSSSLAASYTMRMDTYDAGGCISSEPVNNNSWQTATCVGTFATELPCNSGTVASTPAPDLATCGGLLTSETPAAGCASTCGNRDFDYYRVGSLSHGQVLHARLDHDATQGPLTLEVYRITSTFTELSSVEAEINFSGDDVVELDHIFSTELSREVVVLVRPQGSGAGYAAQPYTLDLQVSGGCFDDVNDLGDLQNDTPATASALRPTPVPGNFNTTVENMTRCGGDVDVYSFFTFPDDGITATLTGAPGITLNIGRGIPGNLNEPAEVLATSVVIGSSEPPVSDAGVIVDADSSPGSGVAPSDTGPSTDAGVTSADAGTSMVDAGPPPPPPPAATETVEVTFTGTAYETLYLTVEGAPAAVGAYTLEFNVIGD